MCVFFSTEKWSIKYSSYCIVATAQMKFASVVVVVALLFYVHGKRLRSCRDGQLT